MNKEKKNPLFFIPLSPTLHTPQAAITGFEIIDLAAGRDLRDQWAQWFSKCTVMGLRGSTR